MDLQSLKLNFIIEFAKLNDEYIIRKLDDLLKKEKIKYENKSPLDDFIGIINNEEADELKKIIAAGCEKIDHNEW